MYGYLLNLFINISILYVYNMNILYYIIIAVIEIELNYTSLYYLEVVTSVVFFCAWQPRMKMVQ